MLHTNGTEPQQTIAQPAEASTNAQRVALYLLGKLALAGFLDAELSDPDSLGIAFDTLADGLQQAAGYSAFRELAAGLE
jgi:hypothetical protein